MTSGCVWSQSESATIWRAYRLFQTMSPETVKALFPNLILVRGRMYSSGWWPKKDGVVLVHFRQRQLSLWGTEGIYWRGPCTLTTPLCTGSDKWLATSAVLSVPDGHDRVHIDQVWYERPCSAHVDGWVRQPVQCFRRNNGRDVISFPKDEP